MKTDKKYLTDKISKFYDNIVESFSSNSLDLFDLNNLSQTEYIKLIRLELRDEVNTTFELIKFDRSYKNIPCIKFTYIPNDPLFEGKKIYSEAALMDGGKDLNTLLSLKQIQYLYSINVALPFYDAENDMYYTVEDLVEKGVYKFLN